MFLIGKSKGEKSASVALVNMAGANPMQCAKIQNWHRLDLLFVQPFQDVQHGRTLHLYFSHFPLLVFMLLLYLTCP